MENIYFEPDTIFKSKAFSALGPDGTIVMFFLLNQKYCNITRLAILYKLVRQKVKIKSDSIANGITDLFTKGFIDLSPDMITYNRSDNYISWKPTKSKRKPRIAQIYFIQAEGNNLIKIGIAINPKKRLRQLQSASPVKLHLLKIIEGSFPEERELHKRFKDTRTHGEWFLPTQDLLDTITNQ